MFIIDYNAFVFKESDTYVAYNPDLDLSSCGNSIEQAKEMLNTTIRLFIEEAAKMGTLEEILSEPSPPTPLPSTHAGARVPRGEGSKSMEPLKNILAEQARQLRKSSTEAEAILWKHLRSRQICGLKFRRQEAIGKFIADFVCFEEKIIIELDGKPHEGQKERDAERDVWLEGQGFKVLRFWNNEILHDAVSVLQKIKALIPPRPVMGEGAGGEGL